VLRGYVVGGSVICSSGVHHVDALNKLGVMSNEQSVSTLWAVHVARGFPRSMPDAELGGLERSDLAELDTFIAGYISRVVEGRTLQSHDVEALARLSGELNTQLRAMSGSTAAYYSGLASAAAAALSSCRM
jgi:hypothetical protein